jgi:hypothetical protein
VGGAPSSPQVRAIVASDVPRARAIYALAIGRPPLLLLFPRPES